MGKTFGYIKVSPFEPVGSYYTQVYLESSEKLFIVNTGLKTFLK